MSEEAVQARTTAFSLVDSWVKPAGEEGGTESLQAALETVAVAAVERLPAASKATTLSETVCPQESPETVYQGRSRLASTVAFPRSPNT